MGSTRIRRTSQGAAVNPLARPEAESGKFGSERPGEFGVWLPGPTTEPAATSLAPNAVASDFGAVVRLAPQVSRT